MRHQVLFAVAVGMLWGLGGCGTVPITGRTQVNLLSDAEIQGLANSNYSSFMKLAVEKKAILSPSESPQAASIISTVKRVSDKIVNASGLRGQFNWETVVVKSKQANAFVMPNGKIVVFSGLFPIVKNDAGLAAVLGHEVAHVVARHGAERVSQALLAQAALTAADAALAARSSRNRPAISAALGMGAQYGVLLPFSREHESEADRIGLIFMARAGYDPEEAIGVWERMEKNGGAGPWEFLSTHPSPATRRSQIREWLSEAKPYFANPNLPLPANLVEAKIARDKSSARTALAPIATLPTFQQGFWFRTQSSAGTSPTTFRFSGNMSCASGSCMVVEADNKQTGLYTQELGLAEVRNADGSWTRFSPPLQRFRWPLKVGESWAQTVSIENSIGRKQAGAVKVAVVDYEKVLVRAGEFMAYKVVVSLNGALFQELWYAPETRTAVRSVQHLAKGTSTSELIDYQKSEEPAGALRAD